MAKIVRLTSAIITATILCASVVTAVAKEHPHFIEPKLFITKGGDATPQVALTLDACSGQTDQRILNALVENHIPATIFVTGRWLKHNAPTVAIMKAHPDLFELENHGLNHIPAIDNQPRMFGLKTAGSLPAIRAEIQGGVDAMAAVPLAQPAWYRDATARYSDDAVTLIHDMGYRVAGYSLNADMGASLMTAQVEKRMVAAKDGDVIIAHINQPTHAAGAGVVQGILALKHKGFRFVRLRDVQTSARPIQPNA
jgi:peptidoglycan/xylan/chitin deacetylase (PgdA/CDA1 family)